LLNWEPGAGVGIRNYTDQPVGFKTDPSVGWRKFGLSVVALVRRARVQNHGDEDGGAQGSEPGAIARVGRAQSETCLRLAAPLIGTLGIMKIATYMGVGLIRAAVASIAITVALTMASVPTAAAMAEPSIPDEWFFDGAKRPAVLKGLEGKAAPALALDPWIGSEMSLKDQRGKVVIVDFWATWCGPCMAAIPKNVEMVKKYGEKGMVFVGVHDANSGWDEAAGVVKQQKINYPVAKDKGGASAKAYQVQFWPTYVAIDRKGVVRAAGLLPNRVEDVVKLLLAEDGPSAAEVERGFGPEIYLGGANRPATLKAVEGKAAPTLAGETWLGKPAASEALKGSVLVLHFANPASAASKKSIAGFAELEKEFANRGVVFVGVCDAAGPWDEVEAMVKGAKVQMPFMQDVPVKVATKGDGTAKPEAAAARVTGVNAAAFGVKFFPATVVVDRKGVIRAAGVKPDKVKEVVEALLAE
jgi:thiol-disulfide isomerase/thioredoxin